MGGIENHAGILRSTFLLWYEKKWFGYKIKINNFGKTDVVSLSSLEHIVYSW